ncbi:hypothetical protein NX059_009211 [Plenodomus lindquistii]|nr:hypothetical protein NX059_009211 [Plenodomus lindquistii]
MIHLCTRATLRSSTQIASIRFLRQTTVQRTFSVSSCRKEDPRIQDFGREITDEFAVLREKYQAPKNTIVLAHGLLGFDELRLAGKLIPGIHYWRGITDALAAKGIEVIVAAVPPSGSIEARSAKLAESIALKAKGKQVNIIAYVGMMMGIWGADG